MGMASHKGDEGWSNLWLLLLFVFANSSSITIQGIYNNIKFQKYILVRTLLLCLRNNYQDFTEYSITWRGGWKGVQIFSYSKFSFRAMRKKLLDFTKSLNTSYFEMGWIILRRLRTVKDLSTSFLPLTLACCKFVASKENTLSHSLQNCNSNQTKHTSQGVLYGVIRICN